jgi:pimeloyl-ACP methyl ester carboxylesterase
LLLAHATGLLARNYEPLCERLGARFHVWGLDFRAHGASSRPETDAIPWRGMADDVLAAIGALGLDGRGVEAPFGFGHSMGGAALVLAELGRPGTFRSLYLYEPVLVPTGGLPTSIGDNPMSAAARRRRPTFATREAAYENYAAKPPMNEMSAASLRAYVEHGLVDQPDGTVTLACRPEDEAATFAGAGDNGAFERLGELDLPVTVARGSIDSPGPAGFTGAQAERLTRGRFVVLPDLGHFGPLQDPDLVATSVITELLG